jgi:hypothetical protein
MLAYIYAGVYTTISSIRSTEMLPDDGDKLPKQVGAQDSPA